MKKILLPYFIVLFFISCNEEQKKNTENKDHSVSVSNLREMIVEKEDGNWGGDIVLHIERIEKISSEITAYKIISLYKGKPVGFNMTVKQPTKKDMFVNKGITFLALKDTSNNFLNALAEIYEVKSADTIFKDSITITYADLTAGTDLSKPGNWAAAQKKLFFETDDDNPELFLNIDEAAGTISFPEKDKDYRAGIIHALSMKLK
jgi:hypothetical protein